MKLFLNKSQVDNTLHLLNEKYTELIHTIIAANKYDFEDKLIITLSLLGVMSYFLNRNKTIEEYH